MFLGQLGSAVRLPQLLFPEQLVTRSSLLPMHLDTVHRLLIGALSVILVPRGILGPRQPAYHTLNRQLWSTHRVS